LANTARNDAAQHILDAQAIRDQAALRETAAPALRDQAVIDQQTADQARLAAQQLAAQAVLVDQLFARFGYFGETLTDAASEWFDAFVLATIPDMQTLYTQFQARFAFNVTDQWQKKQVF